MRKIHDFVHAQALYHAGYSAEAISDMTGIPLRQVHNRLTAVHPPAPYISAREAAPKVGVSAGFLVKAMKLGTLRHVFFGSQRWTTIAWISRWMDEEPQREARRLARWAINAAKAKRRRAQSCCSG